MSSSTRPCQAIGPSFVLLTAAFLLGSCAQQEASAAESSAAEHEHPSVQVTAWGAGLELFIEYEVPEAGEPVRFITHVTETATGAPRRAGPVTFALRAPSGEAHEHTDPAPAREGIYLPELVFATPGSWGLSLSLPGPDGPRTVSLPPVEVAAAHADLHAVDVPVPPEGISFLKEQQWRFGTRIAPIERRPLTDRLAVPAVVRAAAERQADVTPPIAGRLEAPDGDSLPHIGDMVAVGQLLGYVRPPFSDYLARIQESEAEIVRTELAAQRERSRLVRTEALVAKSARSARELEEARFSVQLADAEHAAARSVAAALKTSGVQSTPTGGVRFELRSPIAGFVREVSAVNGTHVGIGKAIFRIRDSSYVHLDALVRPEQLATLNTGERLLIVRARGSAGPLELSLPEAELVFIGDELDPHTLTVPVHFEVPNPDLRLRIGERVEVQLQASSPTSELALPSAAIVEENGRPTVYVQLGGETFEKRQLTLGFRDGSSVQVLDGLSAGEHVVVEGGYAIRLASLSDSAPSHGHAH